LSFSNYTKLLATANNVCLIDISHIAKQNVIQWKTSQKFHGKHNLCSHISKSKITLCKQQTIYFSMTFS